MAKSPLVNGAWIPFLLFTQLMLLCLHGCRHVPIGIPPAERLENPAELLGRVRHQWANRNSLKGLATVRLAKDGGSAKGRAVVAIQRPDLIRTEILSFFDQPLQVLVSDGKKFELLDLQQQRFITGPATPENVSRLLPMVLSGEQVVSILLGIPPLIEHLELSLEYDEKKHLYLLTLNSSNGLTQLLVVEPLRFSVIRSEMRSDDESGRLLWKLEFDDFENMEGDLFPMTIRLETQGESRLELHYRELFLNPPHEPALYRLEPPPGASIEKLE